MEQQGSGGGGGRRIELNKPVHPPPQKCPRCDSWNTKFCYYNNYSLSQPRFFCKTCRRYWTHGGTLRNIPVGGGSRKAKKAKTSSSTTTSSNNSVGNFSLSQPAQSQLTLQSTMALAGMSSFSPAIPFYQGGGGYMSSFAGFNTSPMNPNSNPNPSSNNFDSSLNVGSSSNLSLLQGFNVTSAAATFGNSSQGQNRSFLQMLTSEEQQGFNLINSSTSASAGLSDTWTQSPINYVTNINRASDPSSHWSTISTTSINGGASGGGGDAGGSASTQWPDLSGFNPPQ